MNARGLRYQLAALLVIAATVNAGMVYPTAAWAQRKPAAAGAGSLINQGRTLFEDQRYEESIQTLSAALLRPNTSKADRIETYRLLAYNYIVLNRKEEADAAVRGLYCQDPTFSLSSSESPRFKDFFAEVKKKWEAEGKPGLVTEQKAAPKMVTIRHTSPAEQPRGQEIKLTGEMDDPDSRTTALRLRYRAGSQGRFSQSEVRLAESGKFRATIPSSAVKPPIVEYYFEAYDTAGLPIASRGDVDSPLRIAIPAPSEGAGGGFFSSPWVWAGAGALLIGGIITTVLVTRKSDDVQSPGPAPTPTNTVPGTSRVVIIIP